MKITTRTRAQQKKHRHRWRKKFAIIPREVADGEWRWLCIVEFRDVPIANPTGGGIRIMERIGYYPRWAYRAPGDIGPGFPDHQARDRAFYKRRPPKSEGEAKEC